MENKKGSNSAKEEYYEQDIPPKYEDSIETLPVEYEEDIPSKYEDDIEITP